MEYDRLVRYADSLERMLQAEWNRCPRTRMNPRLPAVYPKTNLCHDDLVFWCQMIEKILIQVVAENEREKNKEK